jgi:hypothetical protein
MMGQSYTFGVAATRVISTASTHQYRKGHQLTYPAGLVRRNLLQYNTLAQITTTPVPHTTALVVKMVAPTLLKAQFPADMVL